MTEQELAGALISGPLVKDGDFCSPQAVRPVIRRVEADQADPLVDETSILPSGDVSSAVATAQPPEILSRRLRAELDAAGATPPWVAEIHGEDEWDWLYEW